MSGWFRSWLGGFSFFFSLIREHDDFTFAHPPPSINSANCSPYKFFSHPSFSSSHVQRAHDPPFPFTCSAPPQPFEKLPLLSSPLLQDGRSRRGRDSKLRICFSTSLFTFSRRRAQDEWGRKARRVNRRRRRRRFAFLTLISSFLFFSFPFISLFFSPPSLRIPFERARFSFPDRNSMMNGYWNKVMPMLMLRNVSKLGEYDLLRRAIPFENTFVFVLVD